MALAMNRLEVGFAVFAAVDKGYYMIEIPLLAVDFQAAKMATVIFPLHNTLADGTGAR